MSDFMPRKRDVVADDILSGCDISCLTFFGVWNERLNSVRFGEYTARSDLAFFFKYLEIANCCSFTGLNLAKYNIGKNTVSSNKFKLIKYQYLISRDLAKLSRPEAIYNVLSWAIYGLRKYFL